MARKNRNKLTKGDSRTATVLGSFAILVLFIAQVAFANSLSSKGREITRLEREREGLIIEQRNLEHSLAELGSLGRVRDDALRIGMIEGGENLDYLVPPKVAYRP